VVHALIVRSLRQATCDAFLGREGYEGRDEDTPAGYRNGHQSSLAVKTTMGAVELARPKLRAPTRSSARSCSARPAPERPLSRHSSSWLGCGDCRFGGDLGDAAPSSEHPSRSLCRTGVGETRADRTGFPRCVCWEASSRLLRDLRGLSDLGAGGAPDEGARHRVRQEPAKQGRKDRMRSVRYLSGSFRVETESKGEPTSCSRWGSSWGAPSAGVGGPVPGDSRADGCLHRRCVDMRAGAWLSHPTRQPMAGIADLPTGTMGGRRGR